MAALSALAHSHLKEKRDSLLGQTRQSFGQKRTTQALTGAWGGLNLNGDSRDQCPGHFVDGQE